jgi:hypothetical protein
MSNNSLESFVGYSRRCEEFSYEISSFILFLISRILLITIAVESVHIGSLLTCINDCLIMRLISLIFCTYSG